MEISVFTVENYILEVKEYERIRPSKVAAKSISECNSYFKTTDQYLRTILLGIKQQTNKGRIPKFETPFPNIDVSPKGKLGKKCCNCINNPVSYKEKNILRSLGEKYIYDWQIRAEMYIGKAQNGIPELQKTQSPVISKNPWK